MLLYTTGEPHLTCLAKAQDSHQLQILTWLHEIFREFCSHFWGIRWSSTCFFLSQCEQKILSVLFSIYLYLFFWPEKAADHRCVSRMPIRKIIAFNVQSWEVVQVNICQKLLFLHQLTHNMTTDCSLNYKFSTWKFQDQNMLCTKIVLNVKTKTKPICVHNMFWAWNFHVLNP